MAKRTKKIMDEQIENIIEYGAEVQKTELELAAQAMLDLYKLSHTVVTNTDYKYPGLKAVADALDARS